MEGERERFMNLGQRLRGMPVGRSVFDELVSAYSSPPRAYHSLDHIRACLSEFDRVHELARHPDEVEWALWFHDIVYDARAHDNETRSAERAAQPLQPAAAPEAIARIEALILATRHQTVPTDRDAQLVVDIDLSILGQPAEVFDAYDRNIRLEYAWVAENDYRVGRARVLRSFLERPKIYATEHFRDRYESQARANLKRLLA